MLKFAICSFLFSVCVGAANAPMAIALSRRADKPRKQTENVIYISWIYGAHVPLVIWFTFCVSIFFSPSDCVALWYNFNIWLLIRCSGFDVNGVVRATEWRWAKGSFTKKATQISTNYYNHGCDPLSHLLSGGDDRPATTFAQLVAWASTVKKTYSITFRCRDNATQIESVLFNRCHRPHSFSTTSQLPDTSVSTVSWLATNMPCRFQNSFAQPTDITHFNHLFSMEHLCFRPFFSELNGCCVLFAESDRCSIENREWTKNYNWL